MSIITIGMVVILLSDVFHFVALMVPYIWNENGSQLI